MRKADSTGASKNSVPDQRKAKRLAVSFILAPVLLTLLWAVGERLTTERVEESPVAKLQIGSRAPLFEFPLLGGGSASLMGQKNKVVLINVWATWCVPCLDEMPDLQRLYARMQNRGAPFEILAVSIDALGADAVRKFVDRFGLSFPILLDPHGSIKKLYHTTGVPETFIVDRQGRLLQKIIGVRKWDAPEVVAYLKRAAGS
ncbi:MAG: TlpA disulfide reductase family protein [Nitrospinae bacterium]|nr:TlpA disulfide reductase family protein [Nitrospinota bacterium]